jgi:hypothetical protein
LHAASRYRSSCIREHSPSSASAKENTDRDGRCADARSDLSIVAGVYPLGVHRGTLAQRSGVRLCNDLGVSADEFIVAQTALAADWGFDCYATALRSWIATVAIVEVGYVGEWEEYAHELTARDYIDEVAHRAPSMREKIEDELAVWDERFRAATVQEAKPHLPITEGRVGWWQYRSPRDWRRPASEELARLKGHS